MKKILFIIAAASLMTFGACKKEEDKKDDPAGGGGATPAAPTLNKSILTNPNTIWEPQSGNPKLQFKANGVFRTDGTWKWLNNSDSMEIKTTSGAQAFVWHFNYAQGDSMEARTGSSGAYTKFRDRDW